MTEADLLVRTQGGREWADSNSLALGVVDPVRKIPPAFGLFPDASH